MVIAVIALDPTESVLVLPATTLQQHPDASLVQKALAPPYSQWDLFIGVFQISKHFRDFKIFI